MWRLALTLLAVSFASVEKTMDPVGAHYPILTFEKNENPQNIMIIYTKLNKACQVESDPDHADKPVFAFYWLMDGQKYKRVHSMIQSGIRDRLAVQNKKADGFDVMMNDLKELKTDLKDPRIVVEAKKKGETCEVFANLKLGPSDANQFIRLDSIYSEAKKVWYPPFRKVVSVTLSGVNPTTGAKVKRTYTAN